MSQLPQISKDDFNVWKKSEVGDVFFKHFLDKAIKENTDILLSMNVLMLEDSLLIKEVVARTTANSFALDLQAMDYEGLIEALGEENWE